MRALDVHSWPMKAYATLAWEGIHGVWFATSTDPRGNV